MRRLLLLFLLTGCAGSAPGGGEGQSSPSRYLYVWAGDADGADADFLAVIDVDPGSSRYGDVVNTVPVGMRRSMPHHLEYELPPQGSLLFANAHHHEQVLLFDYSVADRPTLVRSVGPPSPLRFPHDFFRLPNGNVLVSYLRSEGPSPLPGDTTNPGGHGGLAELSPDGNVLRSASAADPSVSVPIRPYAFAHLPEFDRLLTTSALMMEDHSADVVQIWRLSDLTLLHTLPVLPAKLASGVVAEWGHRLPFEPRVMPDGSVLLSTYGCGFYRVVGFDQPTPTIQNVYMIDPEQRGSPCGVPVVVGNYWIMPVGFGNMLISFDVRNPARPIEIAVLRSDSTFRPHWLAVDPRSDRLIVGAQDGGEDRMLMARVNSATGHLSWDESFGSAGVPGLSLKRRSWPHGDSGDAFAHAALFRQ